MKTIILLTLILVISSCGQKPDKTSLENAEYPIVISNISFETNNAHRAIAFIANNGEYFSVSRTESKVVDYLIRHNGIGDTIKKKMVKSPTHVDEEEPNEVKVSSEEADVEVEINEDEEYE